MESVQPTSLQTEVLWPLYHTKMTALIFIIDVVANKIVSPLWQCQVEQTRQEEKQKGKDGGKGHVYS